ncbi:MAG TPA: thioesterase family protein [Bacteroidota bacterium]|nr:thioesterase family protein [Bacteroidota bacterium]
MPRIKFDLPNKFHFSTEIPVRIGDINYGGHLGNDAVLSLAHEARVRFFRHHGWTELDVEGASIIMADAAIMFKAEAFYGDVLIVEVAVDDLTDLSCDLLYKFTNKESRKEIARVKTGIVFFDYTSRKPIRMPESFRSAFRNSS